MHQVYAWLRLELEAENSADLQQLIEHPQPLSYSFPAEVTFNRHGRRRSAQGTRGNPLHLPQI